MRYKGFINTVLMVGSIVVLASCPLAAKEDRLKWNGFLSIGGGITFDDNETYMADTTTGSVYDNKFGFRPDTVFGLQATVDLEKGLSATAQLTGRGGDDFDVELEWAYLTYVINDELTFSGGRRRIPLFYYSATLDLGYSYHWIRPPYEVYALPLTAYEGVDLVYKDYFGDWYSKFNVWAGEAEAPIPAAPNTTMTVRDMLGTSWKLSYEEQINFRAVYSYAVIDFYNSGFLFSEGDTVHFLGGAVALDYGTWFVVSEYTGIHLEKTFNDIHAWYVSGGVRMGAFTPHVTFGEYKEKSSITPNAEEQQSITVGLRYEVHPNAALKLEFASVNDRSDLPETLNGDSEVIVLALDITF